jgi:hypothetical protein
MSLDRRPKSHRPDVARPSTWRRLPLDRQPGVARCLNADPEQSAARLLIEGLAAPMPDRRPGEDVIRIQTICLQYLTGMQDMHHLKMHPTTLLPRQMTYLWIGSVITFQLQ